MSEKKIIEAMPVEKKEVDEKILAYNEIGKEIKKLKAEIEEIKKEREEKIKEILERITLLEERQRDILTN